MPTVDLLHDAADDTGISQTDSISKNTQPTFEGQLSGATGLTATVYDNGHSVGTGLIGGTTGNSDVFTVKPSSALADGLHLITASVRDPDSGQIVTSAPAPVTIDFGAPNVFIVPKEPAVLGQRDL